MPRKPAPVSAGAWAFHEPFRYFCLGAIGPKEPSLRLPTSEVREGELLGPPLGLTAVKIKDLGVGL